MKGHSTNLELPRRHSEEYIYIHTKTHIYVYIKKLHTDINRHEKENTNVRLPRRHREGW
jgi:hypothetical protein